MPSETVYGRDQVDVRVAWGSDQGDVQVATLAKGQEDPNEATDRLFTIVNQWLADAGMPTIDVAELRRSLKYTPMFDGWHASLGQWSDVNRLIKVLKRARDQAFGSPE